MAKAIVIRETGGPDVLSWEDFDPGPLSAGEALVRQEAAGVNFIDVYHRTGLYPLPELPAVIGMEGAGVVEETGKEVLDIRPGDRVAYAGLPPGAYCEMRKIPAHRLVKVPDGIDLQQAAGMMLRGMTARYLLFGCYPVKKDTRILIHAAAGGVGSIVTQWAGHLGAVVIGTAGSPEKVERAKNKGCDHVINYSETDFSDAVREITDGKGVDVVYDSVGQATFDRSLDCLRPMGTMVSFGQSSGSVQPLDVSVLSAKGSLFLTRPSLMHYTEKREALLAHADDLFHVVESGAVSVDINQKFSMKDAAEAHRALESRKTTGSAILVA